MKGQIPTTDNEAGRRIERTREALAEAYARMWLRAAHRRDLALFKGVEPDFEKWLEQR